MYHQELYDAAARRGQVTAWPSFSLCRLTAAAVQSSLALVVHLRHTVDDESYSRQRASVVFPFFVKKQPQNDGHFSVFWFCFCWVVTNKV